MKNSLKYIPAIVLLAATVSSCEDPEHVLPTVNRQGITSVSAIITSGQYKDQELARFEIGDYDDVPDVIVIPVPYYFPSTSDNESTELMKNVRVQAELAPNCSLTPGLTTLDISEGIQNKFVFTDAQGNSKTIIIEGQRVKSSDCELLSFSIVEPEIAGVIDKTNKTVTLTSTDDLSEAYATFDVSPHATIEPDPSKTPLNYNDGVTFKVIAHDGVTYNEYTVAKATLPKLDYGHNNVEKLFQLDPVAMLGLEPFTTSNGPTLAALKNKLVICDGNGTTPIVVNGLTGAKVGEIKLGSAVAGSVTNDGAEHLMIVNNANGGELVNIYYTSSVDAEPQLFYSFTNPTSLPCGSKMKVNGDITGDALILLPTEGISGVTSSNQIIIIEVKGGVVSGATAVTLPFYWGSAPVSVAGMASRTNSWTDGMFYTNYGDSFCFIDASGNASGYFGNDTTGWGLNANCLDSKSFNNQHYLVLGVVSHFPSWGMGPEVYLYNTSDMSKFDGSSVADLGCLEFVDDFSDWSQDGSYSIASGDIVISTTSDGYYMYIYFIDHNSQALAGYVTDCIAN